MLCPKINHTRLPRFIIPAVLLRVIVFLGIGFYSSTSMADRITIPLWPNGTPGFENRKDEPEKIKPRTEEEFMTFPVTTNIHNPSLLAYLPEPEKATGAAVIIAPGGGHMFLTMGREGVEVAEWFQARGIAAFVLKYRLQRADDSPYNREHCVEDGRRAIRLVRSRAQEWNVDAQRIGIMGFSAGGRPALGSGLYPGVSDPGLPDSISVASARPDFIVLIYGEVPREYTVPTGFPPTFMIVTWDDDPKVTPMTQLFLKLKEAGVQSELHVYSRGGHGYGIADRPLPLAHWPARLHDWMADTGLLK
ncbi:MAG: acetyl esterase/lipase [Candidatus Pelagisphaera sp.]|jgi:acetyl esterase/lipase